MCSFNQISSNFKGIIYEGQNQMQGCTMKLRSRQNTSINLTSSEKLRQLKLIRTQRHLFQQVQITQYLLYELFKVEQKATDLIRCKQRKTNKGKNVDIKHEVFLE